MPDRTSLRVAELYARVLNLEHVTEGDDFFQLGGTSLSAMELLDAIDDDLGVRLPPRALYRATVVSELAKEIDARVPAPAEGA
ncbi:phosphopantetheine-binding protein [Streptomyces sp. NY05-11A]|uniref:phosphopantetheine-binding protein n=1 Tax=Streptomyces soliscabiei TaxID=588897 RepID=UPI0029ACBECF|nr:phosphopantetheine-binding protein [Streptomyces sp. NY05-11A]MDX2680517.1 phosphopantetheine-binding protein [Streptomyces sp. NY05-11A]